MLALDFINVGNGDSILIRELDAGRQTFAMLVDCGHDNLVRDDHPPLEDDRSRRIYAGDFLRKALLCRSRGEYFGSRHFRRPFLSLDKDDAVLVRSGLLTGNVLDNALFIYGGHYP